MTGEEWAETVRTALEPYDHDDQYQLVVSEPPLAGDLGVHAGWMAYSQGGTEYGMAVLFLPLGSTIEPTRWSLAICKDFVRIVSKRRWSVPMLRNKP
jgi:hypothetical protein